MMSSSERIHLAATSDLHCTEDDAERVRALAEAVNRQADALVLCGDLTDHGRLAQARALAEGLSHLRVPCAAVLGNHDYEDGQASELIGLLEGAGVRVLDGSSLVLSEGIGIAGAKGFPGGFGRGMLQPFGEDAVKLFVQAAIDEASKLDRALASLDTGRKLVLLHYAPIVETTQGEPPEIRAFLGNSRLVAPIDKHGAEAVFHGHAHGGCLRASTPSGIPVYNVALPVLRREAAGDFLLVTL